MKNKEIRIWVSETTTGYIYTNINEGETYHQVENRIESQLKKSGSNSFGTDFELTKHSAMTMGFVMEPRGTNDEA